MEHVNEHTKLVVGKFYLVTCVRMGNHDDSESYYVPVYGVPHSDPEISVSAGRHYHIDGRFANKRLQRELIIDNEGRTNLVCNLDEGTWRCRVKEVVQKKMKCLRLTTGTKPPPENFTPEFRYFNWYQKQIGKSCAGKKCPHLGTVMHECNGVLVCPLHHLVGDKKKEIIIPFRQVS